MVLGIVALVALSVGSGSSDTATVSRRQSVDTTHMEIKRRAERASRSPISISSRISRTRSTRRSSPMRSTSSGSGNRRWPSTSGRSVRHVKFAGWARTIACMDTYHVDDDPYGMEIDAIDSILPGEVVVVSTGGSRRNAPWGELLSTAAIARGARGAVVDGLVRDVRRIQELGFPLFAAGHEAGGLEGARPGRGLQRAGAVRRRAGDAGRPRVRRSRRRSSRFPAAMVEEVGAAGDRQGRRARTTAATSCRRARICAPSTTSTACCADRSASRRSSMRNMIRRRAHPRLGAARASRRFVHRGRADRGRQPGLRDRGRSRRALGGDGTRWIAPSSSASARGMSACWCRTSTSRRTSIGIPKS